MIREDFHTHTTYSDGKGSPEEMIRAALRAGMRRIGFSDHSYADCDPGSIPAGADAAYRAEIRQLAEVYKDRIEVLCGIEQDYLSGKADPSYDFVIGSVHYLPVDGTFVSVDWTPEIFAGNCRAYFGGDPYAYAENYYERVAEIVDVTACTIIGHFDLIAKFNEGGAFFDEEDPRYVRAWKRAADRLLSYDLPFEINTGAMHRGYRTVPYPSPAIMRYLGEHGARAVLSSDSHSPDTLCYGFEAAKKAAEAAGLSVVYLSSPSR